MKTFARDADTQEILRRLRTITPDSPRLWGKMSAHQMVCHLADACRMATGEKAVGMMSSAAQRTVVKWIALYAPLRWPPGIVTVPEINQQVSGTSPGDFGRDLADAETLLKAIAARRGAAWPVHPIFGRMSETAWLRWAYLHSDHHLRQFGV